MRSVAVVVVVLAAVGVLAKPDCNACFMKNAGKDKHKADTTTHPPAHPQTGPGPAVAVGGEVPTAAVYGDTGAAAQRLSQFRVKRTTGWEQEVQNRLRDVLFAKNVEQLKARPDAEMGNSGQWWEEAPSDMEWPVTRDAWGELDEEAAAARGQGDQGLADRAEDAGVWGDIRGHALGA